MALTFGHKEWFVFILSILLLSDIAILLNIPFIRQIFGFLFLTILPGLLILQILKLNKIGDTEKFVLSVGLSISFLMFFGLLINNLSLGLGYETPLSTISLLISFNIILIVLAIVGYKTNKLPVFSPTNLNLNISEKAFLIVPILFPALSIFGMHVMNTTDNNIILMFLLFLIPIYVIFVCIFNHKFPKRMYPVVIFSISISLLLLMALRSNHIIGADTHREYYFFLTTLDNLHWGVLGHSSIDACLSISLLPTMYHSILNTSSEFLFKILYPLIYSIFSLAIYILSKKYVGELYGFLASCFLMFQANFLWTTSNSRTCIAVLFFALAMMILFNDRIDPLKKRILFIVFMASCMVSHYATTYIFFFILLGTFVGIELLSKKYRFKKVISLTIVSLLFAFIFFWYSQVTETAFRYGVYFIEDTLTNLNMFFIEESRQTDVQAMLGEDIMQKGIPHKIEFFFTWLTFVLIGVGIITLLRRYKEMSVPELKFKKPDFLKEKFEVTYFVIALICVGLLVAVVALPYISIGYSLDRVYSIVITILSVFFVIGGITLSKHFFFFTKHFLSKERTCAKKETLFAKQKAFTEKCYRSSFGKAFLFKKRFVLQEKQKSSTKNTSRVLAYLIILLVLIPYFLCVTGLIYNIFGVPRAIILNSEGEQHDIYFVHDQDSYCAKWLSEYGESNLRMYTDHHYGFDIMISQGKINPTSIWRKYLLSPNEELTSGYIYLRYPNYRGKSATKFGYHNIEEIFKAIYKINKIYDNDVWIYKNN